MEEMLKKVCSLFDECRRIQGDEVYKKERDYREWYLESCRFFCEAIGDGDEDYRRFLDGDNSGNGVSLKQNFDKLSPLFVVLVKKVEMKLGKSKGKGE